MIQRYKKYIYWVFILVLFLVLLVYNTASNTYYQTETGLRYRLIAGNSKEPVAKMGTTAKVHYIQKVGDSIIDQTYELMPLYYTVMPGYGNRYNPLEVFDYGLRKGDSVVTVQLVDSMLKKQILKRLPSWMKPTDEWITRFKVVEVFGNDSLLQADRMKEQERVKRLQQELGMQRIAAYLQGHQIKAERQKDAWMQWIWSGTGRAADTGTYIKALLHIQTLKDTVIARQDTVAFTTGRAFWPYPVEELTHALRAGSTLRMYLPAVHITGPQSSTSKIKANDDLLIEMQVLEMKMK